VINALPLPKNPPPRTPSALAEDLFEVGRCRGFDGEIMDAMMKRWKNETSWFQALVNG